jgi:hypothetical protein
MYNLIGPNFVCLASEPEKSNLFKKEKYYSLKGEKRKGNKKKK